jgi:drug/metabolite transporter (DMT)-like permease
MLAILGGLGAALAWAVATTCSARSSRALGADVTVAWVMLIGLLVLAAPLAASGLPKLDAGTGAWLAAGGLGNVAGLLMAYRALRVGQVGVVAPILSAEGAVTAVIAVIAGQSLALDRAGALALVALGVMLTASVPRSRPPGRILAGRAAALWAAAAALSFGAGLYGTGRAGTRVPLVWAVLPPRLLGVLLLTIPLAARSSLRVTRATAPLLITAGLGEVAGFLAYAFGARHGLATTAVLASLTGAVAAGMGRMAFGERLRRIQFVGVAAVAVGVGALSALAA